MLLCWAANIVVKSGWLYLLDKGGKKDGSEKMCVGGEGRGRKWLKVDRVMD